ncbi:MAG: hypothetical protein V4723_21945 [Pseudomonadota bacterium]
MHLDSTKNGDDRQVPLSSTAMALLHSYMTRNVTAIGQRGGRLLPFWNGNPDERVLDATTSELSTRHGGPVPLDHLRKSELVSSLSKCTYLGLAKRG